MKKEAKTFIGAVAMSPASPATALQKFFGSFFQKRTLFFLFLACAPAANAQTALNLIALHGLAPFTTLPKTASGWAALDVNFKVTGDIQRGTLKQPLLLPFAAEQQQALKDSFITNWNAAGLADGLGSSLEAAYLAKARYTAPKVFTSAAPTVANLIAYTNETTASDSNAGKYFLANATTDGTVPVSPQAAAILHDAGGVTDVFGKAYHHPAGSPGADPFGNSRPFQTEPDLLTITGNDYFGQPSDSTAHLRGPAQDLTKSPSFPSGHTTYGYAESLILGLLVPSRYAQQMARAAEYGNNRIILGAHYAMDVIAGRALALHDLAHLLANDPRYVGQKKTHADTISDFPAALRTARADLTKVLVAGCGHPVMVCAGQDTSRFANPAHNAAFYSATLTYGLPVVFPATAGKTEDVAAIAPEAGYLLTAAFPGLSLAAANEILTETEGPGGGFLDDGSAFGVYARIDIYAAIEKAEGK